MTQTASTLAERKFVIGLLDPKLAPRIAPAASKMRALLAESDWVGHDELLDAGLNASDLAPQTVKNVIRKAVAVGFVELAGSYVAGAKRRPTRDTRRYKLIDWPSEIVEEKS